MKSLLVHATFYELTKASMRLKHIRFCLNFVLFHVLCSFGGLFAIFKGTKVFLSLIPIFVNYFFKQPRTVSYKSANKPFPMADHTETICEENCIIIQKNRKRKGKLLPKNEEISGQKAHTNTWKLDQSLSTTADVFLNQKRY